MVDSLMAQYQDRVTRGADVGGRNQQQYAKLRAGMVIYDVNEIMQNVF